MIGYSFSNKSIFDGNVIQITKLSSCLKMFIKWHASDLYKSISHQSVNINSPIHSIVLSALRRSGKIVCLVWWFQSGFFGRVITTSWKFLSRRILFKKEILPDHRSVLTEPEGSTSSQNEWQSHIRSLSLLLTVLFQEHIKMEMMIPNSSWIVSFHTSCSHYQIIMNEDH